MCYVYLSGTLDTLDGSLRTATLSSSLTHGRFRRRDAPRRRILRRVNLERPSPRAILPPLHRPDSSTRGWRRNGDLPGFAEIRVPGFESRSRDGGVVPGEVE